MKKITKKLLTTLTSLAMALGLFTGMQLDANAADYNFANTSVIGDMVFQAGDTLTMGVCATPHMTVYFRNNGAGYKQETEGGSCIQKTDYAASSDYTITFPSEIMLSDGVTYKNAKWTFESSHFNDIDDPAICTWVLTFRLYNDSQSTGSSTSAPHACDFQWVTSIDPQCGMDGLEEYKCVKCGKVQESHAIPAGVAYVKDIYGQIKNAPANGTVTYDFGKLATISDYILAKMAERGDVSVTIQFEYKGSRHQITFPAGTDYTAVLTDTDNMYGFYGVASRLGLSVVDITK